MSVFLSTVLCAALVAQNGGDPSANAGDAGHAELVSLTPRNPSNATVPSAKRPEVSLQPGHEFGFEFHTYRTDHFELMYRHQNAQVGLAHRTGEYLEWARKGFFSQLHDAGFHLHDDRQRLTWLFFEDSGQYQDYARQYDGMGTPYLLSYYSARNNRVALLDDCTGGRCGQSSSSASLSLKRRPSVRPQPRDVTRTTVSGMDRDSEGAQDGGSIGIDIRRTIHEMAHQLSFNSDLQKRGVMYPLWVSEGLATNFESDSPAQVELGRDNELRRNQLVLARDGRRLMPLDEFSTLVQVPADSGGARLRGNDLYAQSWAFFQFMFKHHRAELRAYLSALSELDPGERDDHAMRFEFTDAFGSVESLEEAWNDFLNGFESSR